MGNEDSKGHQKEKEKLAILLNELHADVKRALQRSMPTMHWTTLSGWVLAEAMGEVVCAQTKQALQEAFFFSISLDEAATLGSLESAATCSINYILF